MYDFIKSQLDDQYSTSLLQDLKKFGLHNNKMIIKAMKFAKHYHRGQFRKSGEPYYMHPVEVTRIMLPYLQKKEVISGALLHDVVEDTNATLGMILNNFGWRTAEIVNRLTRDRLDGSKWSVEENLDLLYRVDDKDAMTIKVCDRIHNLQTIEHMSDKKRKEIVKESLLHIYVPSLYLGIKDLENEILKIYKKINNTENINTQDYSYQDIKLALIATENIYL